MCWLNIISLPIGAEVPQGSIVGPILFTTYTASLGSVLCDVGVQYHFYADDTQICLAFDAEDELDVSQTMEKWVYTVHDWMMSHDLKMNDDKTEAMFIGNGRIVSQLKKMNISVGDQVMCQKQV